MSKKKLTHDQKRKLKIKKRAERLKKFESMAYHGRKYQAEEYASIVHRTEIGIYESFIVSNRVLTDDDVEASIMELIRKLRSRPLPASIELPSPSGDVEDEIEDEVEDLVGWSIRRNWRIYAEHQSLPSKDDLIGILRTILASLETRRSMAMNPQGYVRFLEGFMAQTGIRMEQIAADSFIAPDRED